VLILSAIIVFFFFSSRRRHTRFSRDWSSDVCSSDLARVNKPTLYKAYSEWVQESGLKPFSRPRFYKRLAEVVNVVEKRPDPRSPWCFEGIGLISDQPDMMF